MSKTAEPPFSTLLSVSPYNNSYVKGISNLLTTAQDAIFSKTQYVISYLNTREFIHAEIEISKNIPDEDLFDAITTKAYDELALDNAVEYQIGYIETTQTLDTENHHFHLFIVDFADVAKRFENIVKQIQYLDIIIPAPLLLKSLYAKEIINANGIDCFIYFEESDASITLYRDGEFLYTKSIKHSLNDMYERFCELYGERIELQTFLDFYRTQNLKETQSDYKEYFIKLYKELFTNINDILIYAKRAFEIEQFGHLYIGSQLQSITQLDEMLEAELTIKSNEFNFNYGFENSAAHTDQLHALMQIYPTVEEDKRYECNFTRYHRPPTFIKRQSGKLILLTLVSLALAFAYPVTYWILNYSLSIRKELIRQEYRVLDHKKVTRERIIKSKQRERVNILATLQLEKKEYKEKKATLIKIHDVKVNYPMKAKLLTLITEDLNRFNVHLDSLNYDEKDNTKILELNLISKKGRKITKLVKYLTDVHKKKFLFTLQKISYDKKKKVYSSQLWIHLL